MDAFYASIEQRDNPMLKGKPVAVGGERQRGVVAAASYEARAFGVHSAMPSVTAKKKCPDLIFVKPRFEEYKKVSQQIRSIFLEYTDLVEPLSLDEAYLDVTENKFNIPIATEIAKEIKVKIKEATLLTASAGISFNKFLAKIASDMRKPDGLYVIRPENAQEFVEKLLIEKFFGIGKVTARKMKDMGIETGKNLKSVEKTELLRIFGKVGSYYYDIARAVDNRPVNPNRERKSVGCERTFENDLYAHSEIIHALHPIITELKSRLAKAGFYGRTLTLKVKFEDFTQITRSKSFPEVISEDRIMTIAVELATNLQLTNKGVRLLGLTVSNQEEQENNPSSQLSIDF